MSLEKYYGKVNILTPKESLTVSYPQAIKYAQQQQEVIWFAEELNIPNDSQDIRTRCTEGERHGVTGTLRLFSLYECVSSDTEVLTPTGWTKISDYKEGDYIAQWSLEDGEIEFVKPIRMFSKHFKGNMVHVYDKWGNVDQLLTPNHRVVYKTKDVPKYRFDSADDIKFFQTKLIPVSGNKKGVRDSLTFEERFKIMTQADGTVRISDYDNYRCKLGGYSVSFTFSKSRKIERFKWILDNLGWEYTMKKTAPSKNTNVKQRFHFRVVVPFETTDDIVKLKQFKYWVDTTNVSHKWCEEFIEEVGEWDGHRPKYNRRAVDFRTTDESSADIVQSIGILCGRWAKKGVQVDNRKEDYSDVFLIRMRDMVEKDTQYTKKEYVYYDDKVYCPTVPSGAFVIRRNGVPGITGNCFIGEEIWGDKIMKMFPHPCIRRMASTFSFMELGVHQVFYQEINKTLNLETDEFYLSWHDDERLVSRMEFIDKYVNEEDPLLSTAAFAFMEGVILFSSFAFLRSFGSSGFNLLPRIVSGINASSKDEFMHQRASCWLHNQCKKEMIEAGVISKEEVKKLEEDILDIAKTAYEHEAAISDLIFEIEGIRTITKDDMLEFVRNRVDDVLKDLGISPLFGDKPGGISEWFFKDISLYSYSDFFVQQSIEYNRQWEKGELIFRG